MKNIKIHFTGCLLAVIVWLATNSVIAVETGGVSDVAALAGRIEAHISQPRFDGALWGVKIVSLDSGSTVFEHHADRLMSPASNSKLYAGAFALERLGADYHIITPILATAKPDANGTVQGDLVIAGRGDPSWNARHAGTNFWDLFTPFVAALTNAGVHRITGDLVGDATFFHSPPSGSGWTADDLENSEGAEISALALNDNCTQISVAPGANPGEPCSLKIVDPLTGLQLDNQTTTVTNGAPRHLEARRFPGENIVHVFGALPAGGATEMMDLPVLRPVEWFAAALKEALRRNGIFVAGSALSLTWPSPGSGAALKLGEIVSPPLRELVRDFMKPSQNLETDLIFEHAGEITRAAAAPPWETSEQCALEGLQQFLATNGLPAAEVQFDEGSGLSRNNLTTANATVALLQFMAKQKAADDFIAALPVAGVDGTLRRRMTSPPGFQNVRAKTGTLRWANALSGFVTTEAGEHLAFSLMLNRYLSPPEHKNTTELDDLAMMLANFNGHTDVPLVSRYASFGTLLVTQFVSAPFPHPARAQGYRYHNDFFSAAEHYNDSTVAMFIPKYFRATPKIDFVVHFHGWRNTVAGTLERYQLVRQFADSGKNAILIVPEGPRLVPDSFGGKLEDTNGFRSFMAEAVEKLRASGALAKTNFEVGKVILSGHSGGFEVMAAILDRGGLADKIRETWLFDALYGNTENFVTWQKSRNGRLLDIYTDHGGTKNQVDKLMAFYRTNHVAFFTAEDTNTAPKNLRTSHIAFLHTDLPHDSVVAQRNTFEQFLKTSCLKDR